MHLPEHYSSSFSIQRATDVDLRDTAILRVRWRAELLPPNADCRSERDDQAAQLFVVFAGAIPYRAINYIWDSTAPVGTVADYAVPLLVRVKTVVVATGANDVGRWTEFARDVARDYRELFGGTPPRVVGIRFQVNSQYTHSHAEGCLADATFTSN